MIGKTSTVIWLIHFPFVLQREEIIKIIFEICGKIWPSRKEPSLQNTTATVFHVGQDKCGPSEIHLMRQHSWESLKLVWKVNGKLKDVERGAVGILILKKEVLFPGWLRRVKIRALESGGQPGLLWAQSSFVFSDIYLSLGRKKTTKEIEPQGPNWHLNPAWLVIIMSVFLLKPEVFLNWVLSTISRVHFLSKARGHSQEVMVLHSST